MGEASWIPSKLLLPRLANELLHITQQQLRLLEGGEMTALIMSLVRHKLPSSLNPLLGCRNEFFRKVGKAQGLVEIQLLRAVAQACAAERLVVGTVSWKLRKRNALDDRESESKAWPDIWR